MDVDRQRKLAKNLLNRRSTPEFLKPEIQRLLVGVESSNRFGDTITTCTWYSDSEIAVIDRLTSEVMAKTWARLSALDDAHKVSFFRAAFESAREYSPFRKMATYGKKESEAAILVDESRLLASKLASNIDRLGLLSDLAAEWNHRVFYEIKEITALNDAVKKIAAKLADLEINPAYDNHLSAAVISPQKSVRNEYLRGFKALLVLYKFPINSPEAGIISAVAEASAVVLNDSIDVSIADAIKIMK